MIAWCFILTRQSLFTVPSGNVRFCYLLLIALIVNAVKNQQPKPTRTKIIYRVEDNYVLKNPMWEIEFLQCMLHPEAHWRLRLDQIHIIAQTNSGLSKLEAHKGAYVCLSHNIHINKDLEGQGVAHRCSTANCRCSGSPFWLTHFTRCARMQPAAPVSAWARPLGSLRTLR